MTRPKTMTIAAFLILTTACGAQDDDAPLTCTGLMLTEGNPHTLTLTVSGLPDGARVELYAQERPYITMISGELVSAQVDDCIYAPDRLVVWEGERIVDECRTGWDTTQVTLASGALGVCYLNKLMAAP